MLIDQVLFVLIIIAVLLIARIVARKFSFNNIAGYAVHITGGRKKKSQKSENTFVFKKPKTYIERFDLDFHNTTHYESFTYQSKELGFNVPPLRKSKERGIHLDVYQIAGKPPSEYGFQALRKVLTHKPSFDFLKHQHLERFKILRSKYPMFDDYLKLHKTFDATNRNEIMVRSGIVAFMLGIRDIRDLDLLITKKFTESDDFPKVRDVEHFDIAAPTKDYSESWIRFYSSYFGPTMTGIDEIMFNPKNYFYYMGMKTVSIAAFVRERFIRQRPKAIAGLRMIKKYCPSVEIEIPDIPKYKLPVPAGGCKGMTYITDNFIKYKMPVTDPNWKTSNTFRKWNKHKEKINVAEFEGLISRYMQKMERDGSDL